MSTSLLVALAVTAAAPLAPREADSVLWASAPRDGLPAMRAFLEAAGVHAPSLRPSQLGRSLGQLLQADLLDVAALEAAGVDVSKPITISFNDRGTLVCFASKGTEAVKRMDAALTIGGKAPARQPHRGAKLAGAEMNKVWRAGYAAGPGGTCMTSDSPDALPLLKDAAGALAGAGGIAGTKGFRAATAGLAGALAGYVHGSEADLGFQLVPTKGGLTIQGKVAGRGTLLAAPPTNEPLAGLAAQAPLTAVATLTPEAVKTALGGLDFLVRTSCPRCPATAAADLRQALQAQLTGSAALVVSRVDSSAAGFPNARYFLFPHAYLLQLKDPAAASAALKAAAEKLNASGSPVAEAPAEGAGPHLSIAAGPRQVFVGISGRLLYTANDKAARDAALQAAAQAKPGKRDHAAQAILDGPAFAKALQKISLLDVGKSPEIASLFAASIEVGPLLRALGPVTAFADPEAGGARFELRMNLQQ